MSNKFKNTLGFTAIDNELFYIQSIISPSEFSLLFRIFRATHGYGEPVKALSSVYLQKTTNLSKNTVTKAIKELERLGLLLIKRRSRLVSFYQISVKGVSKLCEKVMSEMSVDLEPQDEDLEKEVENTDSNSSEYSIGEDTGFEVFWSVYDKKLNRNLCLNVWRGLSPKEQHNIMKHLEFYIPSTPDKTYRKDPINYLKNESWKDEVIPRNGENNKETNVENLVITPAETTKREVVKEGTEADKRINDFLKRHGRRKENEADKVTA